MYNPNNFYTPYHHPVPPGPLRGSPRRSPHRDLHQSLLYPRVPTPDISTTSLNLHHQHTHSRPPSRPRHTTSMIVHDGYLPTRGRSLSRSRSRGRRHSHSRIRFHRRSKSRGGWGSSEEEEFEVEEDEDEDDGWVHMDGYRERSGFEVRHRSRSRRRFYSRSRSRSRGREMVEREVITHYTNIDHGTIPGITHHSHHNYSHGHETIPLRTRYLSDPIMTFRKATLRSPWRVAPGFEGPSTEIFRDLIEERRLIERGLRYRTGERYFCVEGYLSPEVMRELISIEGGYSRRRSRSRRGYR